MTVDKILAQRSPVIYSVGSDERITDAVKLMVETRIGALIVLDEQQKIAGILSERDILRRIPGKDFYETLVKDVMTPKERLIMSNQHNDIRYVMSIMAENSIRHIPIVDGEKLLALLSMRDLAKALLTEYETLLAQYVPDEHLR